MTVSFDLGFLVFLNYHDTRQARSSLDEGLDLFEWAEQIGYDAGWVRVHHGVHTLSAPFPFLTAAALRTTRLRLGTAVIPVGYEDPLRFAEDAATTDLLSDGRLELGLSSGIPNSGVDLGERSRIVAERLTTIRAAIAGQVLGVSSDKPLPIPVHQPTRDGTVPLPHGPVSPPTELVATPHSPGLVDRLWYGAGGLSSALRAARLGFNLVLSTIGDASDAPTLGHAQAEIIRRYRDEFAVHHPERGSRVAVGRSILPITDADDQRRFGELARYYDDLVTPEGRYRGSPWFTGQASPLYAGPPDEVVERLDRDPTLALVDELVLTPLSELDTEQKKHVFARVAEHVAPALGWRGATLAAAG